MGSSHASCVYMDVRQEQHSGWQNVYGKGDWTVTKRIYSTSWWCEGGDSNPYTITGVRT